MEWIVPFRWTNLTFDISAYDGLDVLPFFLANPNPPGFIWFQEIPAEDTNGCRVAIASDSVSDTWQQSAFFAIHTF
jgi:hypothetical protein